ncbi:MAG: nickel pincer cofactor biosynthesis protein LarC, partial [Deltaproteobacteria bacterium]|nr:nickel pincer cofactor biosynthesis protein LarC [Deltaproteobacteria bacterium]
VGSLLDLGADLEQLRRDLSLLPVSGYRIEVDRVHKMHLTGAKFKVIVTEHDHQERTFAHIRDMIGSSGLPDLTKDRSLAIFTRLAEAEATVHGQALEKVHFHEVGAVDSIVDVVAAAACLSMLQVDRIVASPLPLGSGFVPCRHGILPLPAPATMALLKGIPVYGCNVQQELVTPTAAAILSTLADSFGPIPPMIVSGVGYGAGDRDMEDRPNLVRAILGRADSPSSDKVAHQVTVIEANIDDMNPEFFGHLMTTLFRKGALDVAYLPAMMKKNRPGTLVKVISPSHLVKDLTDIILSETTSLGVRLHQVDRICLPRKILQIDTPYGSVN